MHLLGVCIILYRDGQVFIARRSDFRDFAAGIWEFPAGRLEKGETLEDAISREAREEMGIEISSHDLIFAYTFDRNGTPLALLNYLCTYSGEITLSEEHDRGEWVDLDTARDRFVFEPQRELVDKIRHRLRID